MEPQAFEATVRATCIQKASREEFAAFLLVAKEYGLNPLTKEIYAFPAKGGGIVPVVSIDGWINLVNSHKACDGFEFDMEHGEGGELISCTCRMFRKDRGRPVTVTEYLSECKRGTEPWKMQHRMLRHKAMIQAARYAFGFSGIYDEDEGEKIAEMRDVTPQDEPPAPPAAPTEAKAAEQAVPVIETEVIPPTAKADGLPNAAKDSDGFVRAVMARFAEATDGDQLNDLWETLVEPNKEHLFPPDEEDLLGAYRRREGELV
ncbi:RecT family recombinase [Bradyrhizobium icense]|nr:RecT family recombinase [Bradyrhizobium icense]